MGGGHHANVPLFMHSEMMEIHAAIAWSSALNHGVVVSVKPSFGLSGCSERKNRLRQGHSKRMLSSSVVWHSSSSSSAVRSSPVPSVARASRLFKSGVLKPLHLNQVKVCNNKSNKENKEEELE
jgi:hypothetical protein